MDKASIAGVCFQHTCLANSGRSAYRPNSGQSGLHPVITFTDTSSVSLFAFMNHAARRLDFELLPGPL
eukprot:3504690-Pleurochrysis_carterae.AAC.1